MQSAYQVGFVFVPQCFDLQLGQFKQLEVAGMAPRGPYVQGLAFSAHVLCWGQNISDDFCTLISGARVGWLEFLGLASISFHKWPSQGSWTSSMAAVAFPQSKHSEREEVWEHLVSEDVGMDRGTASHFPILLISCVTQLALIHAQGTWTPLVKGSEVKKIVSLLTLIWHKMC